MSATWKRLPKDVSFSVDKIGSYEWRVCMSSLKFTDRQQIEAFCELLYCVSEVLYEQPPAPAEHPAEPGQASEESEPSNV